MVNSTCMKRISGYPGIDVFTVTGIILLLCIFTVISQDTSLSAKVGAVCCTAIVTFGIFYRVMKRLWISDVGHLYVDFAIIKKRNFEIEREHIDNISILKNGFGTGPKLVVRYRDMNHIKRKLIFSLGDYAYKLPNQLTLDDLMK